MAREESLTILREQISYNSKDVLGSGGAAVVFSGKVGDCKVAIKKLKTKDDFNKLEEISMKKLNHPNVLKFVDLIEDPHIIYIVLELCDTTVEKYCRGEYKGKVPPDCQALYQMADGLHHIHSKNLAHRDISTGNVLIKLTNNDGVVMKIADFGVCKPASESGRFSMSGDGLKGTIPFIAPELLELIVNDEKGQGHINNDIFSLGCVFYRFLTKDGHPFFKGALANSFTTQITSQISRNILGNKQYLERLDEKQDFARALIAKMINPNKDERPQLFKVKEELNSYLNTEFI